MSRSLIILTVAAMLGCGPASPPSPLPVPGADGRWHVAALSEFDADRVLSIARERAVIVALWATWCTPCLEEMPELGAIQQAHPGLVVLGLATDEASNPAIQTVLDKVRPTYAQGLLRGGEGPFLARLGLEWDGILPKTLLIRPGSPAVSLAGPVTRATISAALAAHGVR